MRMKSFRHCPQMTKCGTFSMRLLISLLGVSGLKEQPGLDSGNSPVRIVQYGTNRGRRRLVSKGIWFFTVVVFVMGSRPTGLCMNTIPIMLLLIRFMFSHFLFTSSAFRFLAYPPSFHSCFCCAFLMNFNALECSPIFQFRYIDRVILAVLDWFSNWLRVIGECIKIFVLIWCR